jgi:hypothetical protein
MFKNNLVGSLNFEGAPCKLQRATRLKEREREREREKSSGGGIEPGHVVKKEKFMCNLSS